MNTVCKICSNTITYHENDLDILCYCNKYIIIRHINYKTNIIEILKETFLLRPNIKGIWRVDIHYLNQEISLWGGYPLFILYKFKTTLKNMKDIKKYVICALKKYNKQKDHKLLLS